MYRNVYFWSRFLPRHVDRVLFHASILVTSRLSRIWMREGIWAVGNWMLQRPLAVKVHFVATCTAKQLQEQAALDVLTSVHVRVPNEMVNIETSLITLKKRGSDEGKRNCIDSLTHWLFTSYIGLFVNFVNDICQFLSMVSGFPELPPALARGDPCSAVCSCTGGDFGSGCRLYSPAHLDIWKNLLDLVRLLIHTQYIYI